MTCARCDQPATVSNLCQACFDAEWENDHDDEYDGDGCYLCGGAGFIITCIDDMCHGTGSCMHGDGEDDCPVCNQDGDKDWIY